MAATIRRPGRRQNSSLIGLLLVLAGLLILLVLAETATRFLWSVDDSITRRTPWQTTRWLGWEHRPSALVPWPPDAAVGVKINEDGFAGREFLDEKGEHVFRVLVYGDDLVESLGTDNQHTFCTLLEEQLNRQTETSDRKRIEVWNCGVGGYSTVQNFLLGHAQGKNLNARFDPDLILLFLSLPNDFLENEAALNPGLTFPPVARKVRRPYIKVDAKGDAELTFGEHRLRAGSPLGFVCNHSALANLVFVHPALQPVPLLPPSKTVAAAHRTSPPPRFAAGWDQLRLLLNEIQYDAAKNNAHLLIVSAPDRGAILHGQDWLDTLRQQLDAPDLDPDFPERQLERIAADTGLRITSLTRRLRQYIMENDLQYDAAKGYGLLYPQRPEFTRRGHAAVATMLTDVLRDNFPVAMQGNPLRFTDQPARTAPGGFTGTSTRMLLKPSSFTATLGEPLRVRKARAVIDEATTLSAGFGYWLPDATAGIHPFSGISFTLDPREFNPGNHQIYVEVVNASRETIRLQDELTLVTGAHFGAIEQPVNGTTLSFPFTVKGWAVSLQGVAEVELLLGDTVIGSATCSIPRPDLAGTLDDSLLNPPPGFVFTSPATPPEPGQHWLRLRIVTLEGDRHPIGKGIRVVVPL